MKTIAYRIWDKENKKFHFSGSTPTMLSSFFDFTKVLHTRDKMPYQQYTGLSDKNQVWIYEGDIVVFIFENRTESLPYLVFFEDGSWWVNNSQTKQYDHLYPNLHSIKVIGNIHENLELLETEVELCKKYRLKE